MTFRRDHLMIRAGDGRWVRWRLPADFVAPSPTEPNLASSVEAARAVQAALRALAAPNGGFRDAVIALPDRAAHAGLSEGAGSRAVRRLRSELVRGLATTSAPSSSELDGRFRFGTLASGSLGRRSVLGAVTGSPVARQYEAAAEAAGLRVRWVDATSLALLPEWLARAADESHRRLLLLLHRRHFVLATATGGRLSGFRMKLRAALDPDPPALAIRRATESGRHGVSILGDGAAAVAEVARSMASATVEARDAQEDGGTPAVSPVTDGALAALLRRVGERPAPLKPTPVAVSET
ncbi:MAG: hypothetical protein F4228_04295 [Acidobacteria bacterium]|nr:hypothetical protein [Acidobacteriota bacterium]MYF13901.1 hypothetical protein [Acidobacteriota bacterium]MYI95632.1 hypothetical protein [Acidobacteriota bacterium]